MLRDNGVWAGTLKRDNVQLHHRRGIREITPKGIVTADGDEHDVDVIIYGTGFTGVEVPHADEGDRAAAASTCTSTGTATPAPTSASPIPGFPNLFCLYGPNTNIVVNGSIVYFSECGVRLHPRAARHAARRRRTARSTCARTCTTSSTSAVDAENRRMAWGASDVNSWYKNEHGHVAQNWPFTLLEYWQRTLAPDPDDYELLG